MEEISDSSVAAVMIPGTKDTAAREKEDMLGASPHHHLWWII